MVGTAPQIPPLGPISPSKTTVLIFLWLKSYQDLTLPGVAPGSEGLFDLPFAYRQIINIVERRLLGVAPRTEKEKKERMKGEKEAGRDGGREIGREERRKGPH